jgi:hypothetical protein
MAALDRIAVEGREKPEEALEDPLGKTILGLPSGCTVLNIAYV